MEKIPLITMFLKNSGGLSSKRICGMIGWIMCMIIFVLGFALEKSIPDFAEIIIIVSASLLGLDSLTGIWSKTVSKN